MNILIIDDDRVSRAIIGRLLAKEQTTSIEEAESAEQALELLEAGLSPDLAFLDLMLPNLSGESLLGQLRNDVRWSKLPVVVCSSSAARSKVEQIAKLRISGYLIKPVNASRLRQVFRSVADRSHSAVLLESAESSIKKLGLSKSDYEDLLEMFSEESKEIFTRTRAATQSDNQDEAQRLLEILRSNAGSIGAQLVKRSVQRIAELLLVSGTERIGGGLNQLETDLQRTNEEIEKRLSESKKVDSAPKSEATEEDPVAEDDAVSEEVPAAA